MNENTFYCTYSAPENKAKVQHPPAFWNCQLNLADRFHKIKHQICERGN